VSKRSIDEDRPTKRHGSESRVYNGDTKSRINGRSSGSTKRGPRDEFLTPWLLRSVATSEEDEV